MRSSPRLSRILALPLATWVGCAHPVRSAPLASPSLLVADGEDDTGSSPAERIARAKARAVSAIAEQVEVRVRGETLSRKTRALRRSGETTERSFRDVLTRTISLRTDLVLRGVRVTSARCSNASCSVQVSFDVDAARASAVARHAQWLSAVEVQRDIVQVALAEHDASTILAEYLTLRELSARLSQAAEEAARLGAAPRLRQPAADVRLGNAIRERVSACIGTAGQGPYGQRLLQQFVQRLEEHGLPISARDARPCSLVLEITDLQAQTRAWNDMWLSALIVRGRLLGGEASVLALDVEGRGLGTSGARARERALDDSAARMADELVRSLGAQADGP
jgi:hypothetical protein